MVQIYLFRNFNRSLVAVIKSELIFAFKIVAGDAQKLDELRIKNLKHSFNKLPAKGFMKIIQI